MTRENESLVIATSPTEKQFQAFDDNNDNNDKRFPTFWRQIQPPPKNFFILIILLPGLQV
jgi:hypothetical protein